MVKNTMKYGVFRCQFPLNQSIEWFTIIFAYGNGNEIKIKVVGVAGSGRQGIEIWGLTLAMNRWNFSAIHQNCYGWVKQGLKWIQNFMTLTIWNGAFIYIYTQLYIYIIIYNYVYIYIIIYIYVEDDSIHVRSSVYHLILTHMAVVVAGGVPVLARRSIDVSPLLPVGKWMYYHIYICIYIYTYI